ncbi:MAG: cyclodeaminase/cyclohydrolase family protein [Candidatus Izemoplasmataceae bacterium]
MKLIDYTLKEFITNLDSASPAPGGGSASAVATTMGIALSRMVGHLTIPKKKFQKLDESIQNEITEIHAALKESKRRTLELTDEDSEAFNGIMKALKMPKETEMEKAQRTKALQKASVRATEAPLEIAREANKALEKIKPIAKHGIKSAISDIGVGALMLYAGLEGAVLNVRINLSGLDDEAFRKSCHEEALSLLESGKRHRDEILAYVNDAMDY